MSFIIQVSNPRIRQARQATVETLARAIEDAFHLDSEDAYFIWNGVPVRVSYKYDLSVMIDDAVPMLTTLISTSVGRYEVNWGSDTFRSEWTLSWAGDALEIASVWVRTAGNYDTILNERANVDTTVESFINEWTSLLRRVADSLRRAEIGTEDPLYAQMMSIIDRPGAGHGYLYARDVADRR